MAKKNKIKEKFTEYKFWIVGVATVLIASSAIITYVAPPLKHIKDYLQQNERFERLEKYHNIKHKR